MEYVELHARSAFSFLRGAATPEEIIAVCSELKMPAMALLDNDGVYGAARFHLAGKKLKVKAHIGAELTVQSPKSKDERYPCRHWTLDVGRWTKTPNFELWSIHSPSAGSQSHGLSKSLPANHSDEAARAETRKAGEVCGDSR